MLQHKTTDIVDRWLEWYHSELSKKPGNKGEKLHSYQQDAIKQLVAKFGEHYPRYVRLMSEKPPEPTTKAARERWEHEMRELIAQFGRLIAWDMGTGKLQPDSEPVLTPQGWIPIGGLQVGDNVIGSDGKATQVLGIFPQGIQPIVRVSFQDGSWTRCSWDHLWTIQHNQNDTGGHRTDRKNPRPFCYRTMTTREIVDAGLCDRNGNLKWRIPIAGPIHFQPVSLPLDPYTLGIIMGDGGSTAPTLRITTDKEIIDNIGLAGHHAPHTSRGITEFTVHVGPVTQAIRALGLWGKRSWEKFVPSSYLLASPDQRLALLQGLMDTDGSPMHAGGAEFSSSSPHLIDAVIELTQSLGGIARNRCFARAIYTYKGEKQQGRPCERVNIKLPAPLNPFRLTRKRERYIIPTKYQPVRLIASVQEDGEEQSRCIGIAASDGLYVTRNYVVTHNTAMSIVAAECLHHFYPKLFDDGEQFPLPTLIICQKSTINLVWIPEIKRWSTKSINRDLLVVPTEAEDAERALMLTHFIRPFFIITTYDAVRCRLEQFKKIPFGIIIVDECHTYKHSAAKRSQALYQIQNKARLALGGTPITNRPDDIHAILAWVQGYTVLAQEPNGFTYPIRRSPTWGSYADFVDTYCEIENGYYKKIVGGKNLTPQTCQLCRASRCTGCRYQYWESTWRKKYCAECPRDLPPACDTCDMALHPRMTKMVMSRLRADQMNTLEPYRMMELRHELTLTQANLYKQIQAGYVAYMNTMMQSERELQMTSVLAQWNYAKALCVDVRVLARFIENRERRLAAQGDTNGHSLMDFVRLTNITDGLRPENMSGKLNRLLELIADEINLTEHSSGKPNKVLIFTQFVEATTILGQALAEYHPVVVNGEANQKHLTSERVQEFQEDEACRVLIGTSAAFEGLNLQAANYVVLYGHPDWSPMRLLQAIKRAHRQGQTRTVTVIKLLAENSIEENLQNRWYSKQQDFDQAIDGGAIQRDAVWRSLSVSDIIRMV